MRTWWEESTNAGSLGKFKLNREGGDAGSMVWSAVSICWAVNSDANSVGLLLVLTVQVSQVMSWYPRISFRRVVRSLLIYHWWSASSSSSRDRMWRTSKNTLKNSRPLLSMAVVYVVLLSLLLCFCSNLVMLLSISYVKFFVHFKAVSVISTFFLALAGVFFQAGVCKICD